MKMRIARYATRQIVMYAAQRVRVREVVTND